MSSFHIDFVPAIRDKNFNGLRYYGRFRDDCFVLWNGNTERLNDFHKFIYSIDSNLQFSMEIGGTSLDFLDLRITIVDNKLHTTVYSKPTDSHLYLQAGSMLDQCSFTSFFRWTRFKI